MNRAKTLGAAAAALVLAGLAVAAWVRAPDATGTTSASGVPLQQGPSDPMLEARSKGTADAPITIYELSDFQCPFCKMFIDSTWSALLAEFVQRELKEVHPGPDRGVKQGPLAVITNALMPAVLIEVGFMSNPQEERLLGEPGFQKDVARAVSRAVLEFFRRYPPGPVGRDDSTREGS